MSRETVEFEVHFKEEEISGYMFVDECDDETPLRFYSQTGSEQWEIPSNPYRNPVTPYEMICESDYDIIVNAINTTDIIDYLIAYKDELGRTVVLDTEDDGGDVILIIN